MLNSRAASASACAWFPEEWVHTEVRPGVKRGEDWRRRRAWKAPRALNAPIRWRDSVLKCKRMVGRAGGGEEEGRDWGVEARRVRVLLVKTGVR